MQTNCQSAKSSQKFACAKNYTSANMVCITLDGWYFCDTPRGLHSVLDYRCFEEQCVALVKFIQLKFSNQHTRTHYRAPTCTSVHQAVGEVGLQILFSENL